MATAEVGGGGGEGDAAAAAVARGELLSVVGGRV